MAINQNIMTKGNIVAFSDEAFAEASNLLKEADPEFRFGTFIEGKGQQFDSWETRRHNETPPDWVIVELDKPYTPRYAEIDTKWHLGNHAEYAAIYGLFQERPDKPNRESNWETLLAKQKLEGHARNRFELGYQKPLTHILLENYPDGGISRLRLFEEKPQEAEGLWNQVITHTEPIPEAEAHPAPEAVEVDESRWTELGPQGVNLARLDLGARIIDSSNNRYGDSLGLLSPSKPENMGDGWETARSRNTDSYQHVVIQLAKPAIIEALELDFAYFIFNNPLEIEILGKNDQGAWESLVPRKRSKEFAGETMVENSLPQIKCSQIQLRTYPCGGLNRLRVIGKPIH